MTYAENMDESIFHKFQGCSNGFLYFLTKIPCFAYENSKRMDFPSNCI